MSKRPFVILGIVTAICVLALPLIALRGGGTLANAPVAVASHDEGGRELFAANCGQCHTLAAAGTLGVVGPDLDRLLAPSGIATYDGSYARALYAVTCGIGGRMPAGILDASQAQDVSSFVGAYAGQIDEDDGPLADTRTAERPPAPSC